VGKYESGSGLGRNPLQVGAVPSRSRRCEEARRMSQLGIRIEANPKAVGIVLAPSRVL
jgi:hypothetical protein